MSEILAHAAGDYIVQSDWMAAEKTKRHGPALLHAASYAACFLPLTRNPRALAVIGGTHFVIDRWRLAKHVGWAKNQLAPKVYRPGAHDHRVRRGQARLDGGVAVDHLRQLDAPDDQPVGAPAVEMSEPAKCEHGETGPHIYGKVVSASDAHWRPHYCPGPATPTEPPK